MHYGQLFRHKKKEFKKYIPHFRTAVYDLPWKQLTRKWIHPATLTGLVSNRGITYSRINYKKRKVEAKKIVDETEKKTKNKIKILRIADIWKNMTVQELANSLERDIGMVHSYKIENILQSQTYHFFFTK